MILKAIFYLPLKGVYKSEDTQESHARDLSGDSQGVTSVEPFHKSSLGKRLMQLKAVDG